MAHELSESSEAPAFVLPRDGGGEVSLREFRGRKLVLFCYPKADTPGCTREAQDFSALADDFAAAGTAVLGLSADPVRAQDKFKTKCALTVPLASDEAHTTLEAYGAWGEKSMYGRRFMGVLRTTFLIDGKGRIIRIWRNVKVPGHAEEVLAAARATS
jgi:peroxiredoxin Q/BCP